MKVKTLVTWLENEGINSSYIHRYLDELPKKGESSEMNHSKLPVFKKEDFMVSLQKITENQLEAVLKMCLPFKEYFESEEYSKLVCRMVLSFAKNHCAALSAFSEFIHLDVCTYATPCRELPDFLVTTCTTSGLTYISRKHGSPLVAY